MRGLASGTGPWTEPDRRPVVRAVPGCRGAGRGRPGLDRAPAAALRLGGFVMASCRSTSSRAANLHENAPAAWKVLQIFGANYAGLSGVRLVLAFLHLASVIMVASAVLLAARRFFGGISLVDQVLAVAIVANVALYLLTNAADPGRARGRHHRAVRRGAGRPDADPRSQPAPARRAPPGGSGWPRWSPGSRCWPGTPPGSATSSPSPPRRRPTPAWRPGCSSTTSPTGSAATGRAAASP